MNLHEVGRGCWARKGEVVCNRQLLESTCAWLAHGLRMACAFDLSLLVFLCHLTSGCGLSHCAMRSQSSGMPWRVLSAAWNDDEIVPACSVLR